MPAIHSFPVAKQYQRVMERIHQAALRAGRNPIEIRLVVVTKSHPLERVKEVVSAGARYLGENYVEEALPKMELLGVIPGLEWHMIGHVQSRKARQVSKHFAVVQSVDSLKLATRLDRFAGQVGRRIPILLEYNVSGEESKFGWPAWDEDSWPGLLHEIEAVTSLPNLEVRGLMTMPPFAETPEISRPYFRRLRRLRDYLVANFPQSNWNELSMGMSADYEVAIEEGASWVRIGQAILGPRPD